jgi:hypothetical protein
MMSRRYFKEITKWDKCDYSVKNHTYIFEDSKCVGYIKTGTKEEIIFSKFSRQFTRSYRKFVEIYP